MRKILSKLLIVAASTLCNFASAQYVFPTNLGMDSIDVLMITAVPEKQNHLSVSPIFGKAEVKQGTVKEDGWLYGIRCNYDLVARNSLYLGAELGYKFGELSGKTSSFDANNVVLDPFTYNLFVQTKTKSKYSDLWTEIRLGYTSSDYLNGHISPFVLIGYEKEKDKFVSPSPLPLKHQISYGYFGCGVISRFVLTNQILFGVNAKFKWMFNTKTQIGHEEFVEDTEISNVNRFHWQIELPLTYLMSNDLSINVAPFYEYKNYDRHKFERLGTEKANFHMYGGIVALQYGF